MDTQNLTWHDKIRIVDITARIAVSMFLAFAAVAELIVVAIG
jgi:hypothetical protein